MKISHILYTHLNPVNGHGCEGDATVIVHTNNTLTVTITSHNMSANLPHVMHIHVGNHSCPTLALDSNHDGLIDTPEGVPAYGTIAITLSTSGDVSVTSALALDRAPVAAADGTLTYKRTFALPPNVTAADVLRGVIVQHGISELFADPTKCATYRGFPRVLIHVLLRQV